MEDNQNHEEFLNAFKELQEKLRSGEIVIEDMLGSQEQLIKFDVVTDHFIENVILPYLNAPWVFVSDGTDLSDFYYDEESEQGFFNLIQKVYGVDVSSIESTNIVEVIKYILIQKAKE